jgi:hypothetical protein
MPAANSFYIDPVNGNNTNAGSTSADAGGSSSPSVTSTNGNWNSTTRVFTAAAGTPFSGVSAGEWASVYNDGAATSTFVAQVTSVGGGGASVTLDATLQFGATTSTSATGRTCKIGGAWKDFAICASGTLLNSGSPAFSMRIHAKFGTYANAATSRTIGMNFTGSNRMWLRGYTSTPGDLQTAPTSSRTTSRDGGTDLPSITFTTGTFTISGEQISLENLDIYASGTSNPALTMSGNYCTAHRCRIENAHANAGAYALSIGGSGSTIANSYCKATATADRVISTAGTEPKVIGCLVEGAVSSVVTGSTGIVLIDNIFKGASSHAVSCATSFVIDGCLFITPVAGDGLRITASNRGLISNCLFYDCGGYDINNETGGSNTQRWHAFNNASYSPNSGHIDLASADDGYEVNLVTESGNPLTAGNPPLDSAALSIGAGTPGLYEGASYTNEKDIGFQTPATGGGSTTGIAVLTGGGLAR